MENPYLGAYLERYEIFFASISGVASLFFVASIFLLARYLKLLLDAKVALIRWPWALWITLVFSSAVYVCVFMASAEISYFLDKLAKDFPKTPVCKTTVNAALTYTNGAVSYFQNCHRPSLAMWSGYAIASAFLAGLSFLIWFVAQIWRRKESDEKSICDSDVHSNYPTFHFPHKGS